MPEQNITFDRNPTAKINFTMETGFLANALVEIDHLTPVWARIQPNHARRTFEVRTDVGPMPLRLDAINQNGFQADRSALEGVPAAGPIAGF